MGVLYKNFLYFPSFLVKIDLISSIGYTIQKPGHVVVKGVNCVHNDKLGQMVLKGVTWVYNAKIKSYGLERSELGT